MQKYRQRLRLGNEVKNVDQVGKYSGMSQPEPWPMNLFRFSIEQILSRNRLGLEMLLKNEILYGAQKCMEVKQREKELLTDFPLDFMQPKQANQF